VVAEADVVGVWVSCACEVDEAGALDVGGLPLSDGDSEVGSLDGGSEAGSASR
jgi:hypothetical protein